jgi:NAD(P)H-hydrate epimerase
MEKFREMDYLSVQEYKIPVELMMENAGLQLARLVSLIKPVPCDVLVGIGTGNNGGGGLVAARRLAGWGYRVFLDVPVNPLQSLPMLQLERALAVGALIRSINHPDIFIDAYLGFSQRLPLSQKYLDAINRASQYKCVKISLDLPTGFDKSTGESLFIPDIIVTLSAMKTELLSLAAFVDIFLADLGLPQIVYKKFSLEQPTGFRASGLLKCRFQ